VENRFVAHWLDSINDSPVDAFEFDPYLDYNYKSKVCESYEEGKKLLLENDLNQEGYVVEETKRYFTDNGREFYQWEEIDRKECHDIEERIMKKRYTIKNTGSQIYLIPEYVKGKGYELPKNFDRIILNKGENFGNILFEDLEKRRWVDV
jgi:hypothetical protein